jgi:hypothetical protein
MPEMQVSFVHLYQGRYFSIPKNTIGFYSSGFWLRKKLNHSIADVGSYDVEEQLLSYLAEYVKTREDLRLVIFTHPYEKRPENISESTRHYSRYIDNHLMKRTVITDDTIRSTEHFQMVNIGVSVFSTIMFERISLGFKTIIAPLYKKYFPQANSAFRNVCVYSREELFTKLDSNLPLSKEEYFFKNGLKGYCPEGLKISYSLN